MPSQPDLLDTVALDLGEAYDRDEIASVIAEMDGEITELRNPVIERFERHPHNGFGVAGAIALFQSLRKAGRRNEAAKIAEAVLAILEEHPDLQTHVKGEDIVVMRSYVKERPTRHARAARKQRARMLDAIQTTAFQALLDKAAPPFCPFTLDPSTKLWHDREGAEISPRTVARYHRLAEMHSPEAAEQIARAVDELGPRVEQRSYARSEAARQEVAAARETAEQVEAHATQGLDEVRRMVTDLARTVESRREMDEAMAAMPSVAPEPVPVAREQAVKYGRNGLIESVVITDSLGRKTRKVMERSATDGRVVRVMVEEVE